MNLETQPGKVRSEYAPADIFRKIRDTLWISTIEGGFTIVFMNWTAGSILAGYMIYLGAGPRELAAVSSLPLLAQAVGPFMAWLATHLGHRIRFIATVTSIGRIIWLFAALLPLLPIDPTYWPICMVALVGISSLFQASAGPVWISLMADVVPEEIRGRYFGIRTSIVGLIATLAAILAGRFIDRTGAPLGFQMILVVAVMFATVGVYLYTLYYEPPNPSPKLSIKQTFMVPLRDANFRRFLLFSMYWQGVVMLAASFVIPYFLQYLKLTYTQVAIWGAIASICSLITSPLWGRIADKVGHKWVLTVTTILAGSVHPACWILATPGHMFFIWLSGVMDAISWGGVNPSMFNMSISAAPRDYRMAYLAVLGMATGLVGCIAGLCSGPLLHFLLQYNFWIGSFQWTGYHTLFVISGFLRMQAFWFLRPVQEKKAWPAQDVLRALRIWWVNNLPWRANVD